MEALEDHTRSLNFKMFGQNQNMLQLENKLTANDH